MRSLFLSSSLITATILILSACGRSVAPPPGSAAVAAIDGAPFAAQPLRTTRRRATRSAYTTRHSLVFEADLGEEAVNVYETSQLSSNPPPIATIYPAVSGCPDGLAMDKKGTLYVSDECNGNDIEEFPRGSTTEKVEITGLNDPSGLAIDSKGTLYVSCYPAAIEAFKKGATSPYETITGQGLTDPFGLAVDAKDNLYIADFGATQVFELKAGSQTLTALNLQDLTEPVGVGIDQKSGIMWVMDGEGDNILVYELGNDTPIETIAGNGFPYAVSIQSRGKPQGTVITSDIETDELYAYKSGQYTPYATLTNGVERPISLLIAKP